MARSQGPGGSSSNTLLCRREGSRSPWRAPFLGLRCGASTALGSCGKSQRCPELGTTKQAANTATGRRESCFAPPRSSKGTLPKSFL